MGRVDCIQSSNFHSPIAWDYSARYDARIYSTWFFDFYSSLILLLYFTNGLIFFHVYMNSNHCLFSSSSWPKTLQECEVYNIQSGKCLHCLRITHTHTHSLSFTHSFTLTNMKERCAFMKFKHIVFIWCIHHHTRRNIDLNSLNCNLENLDCRRKSSISRQKEDTMICILILN